MVAELCAVQLSKVAIEQPMTQFVCRYGSPLTFKLRLIIRGLSLRFSRPITSASNYKHTSRFHQKLPICDHSLVNHCY